VIELVKVIELIRKWREWADKQDEALLGAARHDPPQDPPELPKV
jgi:hypothetical protein